MDRRKFLKLLGLGATVAPAAAALPATRSASAFLRMVNPPLLIGSDVVVPYNYSSADYAAVDAYMDYLGNSPHLLES